MVNNGSNQLLRSSINNGMTFGVGEMLTEFLLHEKATWGYGGVSKIKNRV